MPHVELPQAEFKVSPRFCDQLFLFLLDERRSGSTSPRVDFFVRW